MGRFFFSMNFYYSFMFGMVPVSNEGVLVAKLITFCGSAFTCYYMYTVFVSQHDGFLPFSQLQYD